MLLLKPTFTAFALVALPVSLALPMEPPKLPESCEFGARSKDTNALTETGVNCMISLDPDCWETMKLSAYVTDWIKGRRGRTCGTQGLAPQDPGIYTFGTCFQQAYALYPDCNKIQEGDCAHSQGETQSSLELSDVIEMENGEAPPITCFERRQWSLVLYSITSMNKFFTTWNAALEKAVDRTVEQIDKIVQIASPAQTKKTFWQPILIEALLSGLAFLPLPGLGVAAGQGARLISTGATRAAAQAATRVEAGVVGGVAQGVPALGQAVTAGAKGGLSHALATAPGRIILTASGAVFGKLFPSDGSAASNQVEVANLKVALDNLTGELAARLPAALDKAVNNATSFVEMSETGAFISTTPPSVDASQVELEAALRTYIISIALSASSWFIGRAANTTINMLLDGSQGKLNMDYGCTAIDPAVGWCGSAVYQDTPNNQGLTLIQASSGLNNPYDIIQGFMGTAAGYKYPLTTPQLLLEGAAKCRQRLGAAWGTDTVPDVWQDGLLNYDCLSQLKVCTWRTDCHADLSGDSNDCEYIEEDCPPEAGYGAGTHDEVSTGGNSFFTAGVASTSEAGKFYVSPGYMGPFRTGPLPEDVELTTETETG
ncbi:MAG: hypothetical protein Q9221_008905 [Calogaya cf. arnoldii]